MDNNDKIELLVAEYERTQDMIKHYDDINLRFSSILQSGILILVGLSFSLLSNENNIFLYLFPFVIIFVVLANTLVFFWFKRHRKISLLKISRIIEIEKELGWKQFSAVNEAIELDQIDSHPARRMIFIYLIGLPITLFIAYLVVFFVYRFS